MTPDATLRLCRSVLPLLYFFPLLLLLLLLSRNRGGAVAWAKSSSAAHAGGEWWRRSLALLWLSLYCFSLHPSAAAGEGEEEEEGPREGDALELNPRAAGDGNFKGGRFSTVSTGRGAADVAAQRNNDYLPLDAAAAMDVVKGRGGGGGGVSFGRMLGREASKEPTDSDEGGSMAGHQGYYHSEVKAIVFLWLIPVNP